MPAVLFSLMREPIFSSNCAGDSAAVRENAINAAAIPNVRYLFMRSSEERIHNLRV